MDFNDEIVIFTIHLKKMFLYKIFARTQAIINTHISSDEFYSVITKKNIIYKEINLNCRH